MPGRQKYNFYAVSNGRDVGIYTNWPQAGDSVLGYANAKYKGYITYDEAKLAMESSGFEDFNVFDGQNTYSKLEYEENKQAINTTETHELNEKNQSPNINERVASASSNINENKMTIPTAPGRGEGETFATVYIDGSCIGNGAQSAIAGYGVYWGEDHPWNGSFSLSVEDGPTNNKAELKAAIKAIEIAHANNIERLEINSDSKYVVLGVTQWSKQWIRNGWKNSSGDAVKNKQEWIELLNLANDERMKILWKHIPGHKGIPGNEAADKLALKGATSQTADQKNIHISHDENKDQQESSTAAINVCQDKIKNRQPSNHTVTDRKILHFNHEENSNQHDHQSPQPKILIIPKKTEQQNNKDIKMVEVKLNVTPKKTVLIDHADTPVPGSINGSYIKDRKTNQQIPDVKKVKRDQQIHSDEDNQVFQIMKNMQAVLETVLLEIHQSKEEHQKYKQEVSKQLQAISSKQENFVEVLANIPEEVSNEVGKCIDRLINQRSTSAGTSVSLCTEQIGGIQAGISDLQRNINNKFNTFKSTIQKMEETCNKLKHDTEISDTAHRRHYDEIQLVSQQIYESMSDMKKENQKTRENITEIEKTLCALTEPGEFQLAKKPSTQDSNEKKNTAQQPNTPIFIEMEEDDAVTFPKTVTSSNSSVNTEIEQIIAETTKKTTENILKAPINDRERNENMPFVSTKKQKVYLIGDSIVGQINVPTLGKSTDTFVRRLKAPKIQDIKQYTNEMKDAKVIIVHTGINNLREKEDTTMCINSLIEILTGLKDASPDAKISVSKIIPVGDHDLSIEAAVFNATLEKKLQEVHNDISFIDHSNLSEQGQLIHDYYRHDNLHLSSRGVSVFGGNLKRNIIKLTVNNKHRDDERGTRNAEKDSLNMKQLARQNKDTRNTENALISRHRDSIRLVRQQNDSHRRGSGDLEKPQNHSRHEDYNDLGRRQSKTSYRYYDSSATQQKRTVNTYNDDISTQRNSSRRMEYNDSTERHNDTVYTDYIDLVDTVRQHNARRINHNDSLKRPYTRNTMYNDAVAQQSGTRLTAHHHTRHMDFDDYRERHNFTRHMESDDRQQQQYDAGRAHHQDYEKRYKNTWHRDKENSIGRRIETWHMNSDNSHVKHKFERNINSNDLVRRNEVTYCDNRDINCGRNDQRDYFKTRYDTRAYRREYDYARN